MIHRVAVDVSVEDGPQLRAVLEWGRDGPTLRAGTEGALTEYPVDEARAGAIRDAIAAARVPAAPASGRLALATGTRLSLEGTGASAVYSWVLRPPAGWEPLGEVVSMVNRLASEASGHYGFSR
jgi:hypothetical protein